MKDIARGLGTVVEGAEAEKLLPGGMLRPAVGSHRLLSEDARLDLRGARLLVTLHTAKGKPFRRYDYALDGYGRIRFSASDL